MKANKGSFDKKTILSGLRFAIIASLLISALIIIFTIDQNSMKQVFMNLSPSYIGILFLIIVINWVFAGLRLKFLVNTVGDELSLKDSIIIYLSGAFVSNVTPFASGGGPFQVYFLHKKGINVGKSSTIIVIQFIMRLFYFGILTPIFLIFFNWAISPGVIPIYLFYIAFGVGILFSIGIIIFTLVPGILDAIISNIFKIDKLRNFVKNNHRAKRWLVKARTELREFRYSLEIFSQKKGSLLIAGFHTACYWSTRFIIVPFILKGLGLEPHFIETYVMQTIFFLVIPYTPSPGASGIAEVGFASLFVAFIPQNMIGLITFAWRFLTFHLILIVGGIFAFREIGKK